jgi:excinuclease ABC subunit C
VARAILGTVNELLARKLEQLPADPGVYLFRDAAAELLYVGKARSLRQRVRGYFQPGRADHRLATFFIDRDVADLEFIVTRSEKEALLLENNLIKKLKPRYNLRLRDDKTFLSIRIDPRDRFPRIVPTRRVKKDGALYFGPYAHAAALRKTLRFLRSFVPLRDCKDSEFKTRTRPCLEHEIGRCSAPCVGLIEEDAYHRDVDRALAILRGDASELVKTLRREMTAASERLHYERAAQLRDWLKSLEQSLERQEVDVVAAYDADVLGVHREAGIVEIVVLFVRQGKLVSSAGFGIEHDLPDDELLSEFLAQFYSAGRPVPPEVLCPAEPYGRATLEEWLSEKREAKCFVRVPQRGPKLRMIELARENARLTLLASTDKQRRDADLLEAVARRFELPRAPLRIECFDVSTTLGRQTVASCVAFRDAEPYKTGYRRFRIKDADPADEYASMREALRRHLLRARDERTLPDLLIVDGGKGQWNVARAVLDELGITDVALLALAKGARRGKGLVLGEGEEERIFRGGEGSGIVLDPRDPVTLFLQRVRDEAHRFAIEYHRKRRSATSLGSELDAVPGIGPARRRRLLERFGSVARLKEASEEEIATVKGIDLAVARAILARLTAH